MGKRKDAYPYNKKLLRTGFYCPGAFPNIFIIRVVLEHLITLEKEVIVTLKSSENPDSHKPIWMK